jgi:hypothetical protein
MLAVDLLAMRIEMLVYTAIGHTLAGCEYTCLMPHTILGRRTYACTPLLERG